MGIIMGIILMRFFSFVLADPPSQQDYGLCSQVYIMHQYCTSQLRPALTAVNQHAIVQPRVGKAGPRGPRGIVNYTVINEKIAGKFLGWEAKMEENFTTLKTSAADEVKHMKAGIENKTKEYEERMQVNFTRWKATADSLINQIETSVNNKQNDLEDKIEDEFTRWKLQKESEMGTMKSDIAVKTNEWQGLKDELLEQKISIQSEMNKMRIVFTNLTNELGASLQENFTRWKNFAESEVNELKTDLAKKDEEITILKKNQLFISCEDASPVIEGSGGVVKLLPYKYEVYCDMVTDGGNWIVFQRRMDGSVDFYRTWEEYVSGFGNKSGEFWLGLEALHHLTQGGKYELRIELTDWSGETAFANYRIFSISGRSGGYRLNVGEYSGTAGDSMGYINGVGFHTKDNDSTYNCARGRRTGWWNGGCGYSSLNGRYNDTSDYQSGVYWYHWGERWSYSLKGSEMKFRKK